MEPSTNKFEAYQNITTTGAYDWTHMRINGYHFLVVANTYTREPTSTTHVKSVLYFWQRGQFIPFQDFDVSSGFRVSDDKETEVN